MSEIDDKKIVLWDFTSKPELFKIPVAKNKGWQDQLCIFKDIPPIVKTTKFSEIILEMQIPEENAISIGQYCEAIITFITRDLMWYELQKQNLIAGENILVFPVRDSEKIRNFKQLNIIINSEKKWETDIYVKRIIGIVKTSLDNKQDLWSFDEPNDLQRFQGCVQQSPEYYSKGSGSLKISINNHTGWDENLCTTTNIPEVLKKIPNGVLGFDCYFPPDIKRGPQDYLVIHLLFITDDDDVIEVGQASIQPGWNYCEIPLHETGHSDSVIKIKFALNSNFKIKGDLYLSNFHLNK